MDNIDIKYTKFEQLFSFASELLIILASKKDVPVETICDQIDAGTIVEYIFKKFGFKSMSNTFTKFSDINAIMKKNGAFENDAKDLGQGNSGICYLIQLILDDLRTNMYDMELNHVNPDSFRMSD